LVLVEKIKKPRKSFYCEDQQKITKETKSVTQEQFIIELFCRVEDMLGNSYGIELCHPIRERHQPHRKRIGKKGFVSWKWIVGGKLCLLVNKFGLITG
jgi:hypothetical protein